MQCLLLYLASLVIPMVRDYTLNICHVALLSGARFYEVARKYRSPLSYELPPHTPPHPTARCPFPRAHFFIYVLLPGNSMNLSSNNRCW